MTTSGKGTLISNPEAHDWDFGDFPYGLEPLAMPPTTRARAWSDAPVEAITPLDAGRMFRQLRELTTGAPHVLSPDSPTASSDEQLYWFRWITGHQVTFLIWNMMGRVLAEVPTGESPDRAALAQLEHHADAYSAMLLYTGSCPRSLYDTLIRPRMFLQHRGFSGTWAPDFTLVRGLFRGRRLSWIREPRATGLRTAITANGAVHEAIAARLVPNGPSLLQQSVAETTVRPSERTAALYDNFFMTLRAPVPDRAVTCQLLHRLKAVALDLAVNGLYPLSAGAPDGWPDKLRSDVITDREDRIGDILRQLGEAMVEPV